jgi:trk system potassium uptake protein
MNYRLLAKVLGLLLLLLAGTMLLCLAYALLTHERQPGLDAVEAFWISIGLTAATGGILAWSGRGSGREVLRKEAIAIVGLGWLLCGAFGALPYMFCQPGLNPIEAFFESTSGFTTTGASVIANLDAYPRSLLLWRSFTQWLGGLGILVLFVALLSYLGVGSKALFRHESSAKSGGGVETRIQEVAMRMWQIYLGLTVVCGAGLVALGMGPFEAACHAFTTISTGGFSTRNASIAAFQSVWIELWIVAFMIAGGISFMLYAWLLQGRWQRWRQEEETPLFLVLIIAATVVIAMDLMVLEHEQSIAHAMRNALFQVVSIMTTTGFATADFNQWPPLSKLLLVLLMAIGGCAGSTAGGIKVGRWLLFFKVIRIEIIRAFRPNQVFSLRLNGNAADHELALQTVFFVALAGVIVAFSTALVSLLEPGLDMDSSFSAVVASLYNIGPGLGAVGPTQNFGHLTGPTLTFLSLLMVLGRLEFFALLVLFVPSLWRRY